MIVEQRKGKRAVSGAARCTRLAALPQVEGVVWLNGVTRSFFKGFAPTQLRLISSMAVGAERRHVLGMVMGEGSRLAAIGVVFGGISSFCAKRFLRSQLYEVNPTDPLVFSSVVPILFGVALLACYFPARRAAKVNPMVALRAE
jgi:predicted lysophospholipase L1 biosynthesis ABC-type transport system permease subunit